MYEGNRYMSETGPDSGTPDVIGTWRLVKGTSTDADGKPMRPGFGGDQAIGRLVLRGDGRMMASIIDSRAEIPEGDRREYSAYCGAYTFDGKTLITKVDASADPARVGTDQVRDVSFADGLMILRPPLRPYNGGPPEARTLYWTKISDI
jgi:hypothetical protein